MRNATSFARTFICSLAGIFGFTLLGAGPSLLGKEEDEEAWHVRTYHGMPYLALENIQQNYGFDDVVVQDTEFKLRGTGTLIEGKMNRKTLDINRLSYHLHYAPLRLEGKLYLAAYDVTNVLDLILRPANYMQPRGLQTVYVEAVMDKWSTRPDAKDMALEIQNALSGYGVTVRFLGTNSGGIVGDSTEIDAEGGTAWIRLQGNGKLSHHEFRCSVLAPPGAHERASVVDSADEIGAVYVGNLFDAQSMALATLIQSGLIFGPGAKDSDAIDAGIRQIPSVEFQRASGAAVHVEWGEEIDPVHFLKSVVAGILRYSAFLDNQVKLVSAQRNETRQLIDVSKVGLEIAGADTLKMGISLSKTAEMSGLPDREKIDVQAFVFAREGTSAINLIAAPPPQVTWVSSVPAWSGENPEELSLTYHLEAGSRNLQRETFGYVIRLIYDGQLQDVQAHPQGLLNQLWRYSAIFPR